MCRTKQFIILGSLLWLNSMVDASEAPVDSRRTVLELGTYLRVDTLAQLFEAQHLLKNHGLDKGARIYTLNSSLARIADCPMPINEIAVRFTDDLTDDVRQWILSAAETKDTGRLLGGSAIRIIECDKATNPVLAAAFLEQQSDVAAIVMLKFKRFLCCEPKSEVMDLTSSSAVDEAVTTARAADTLRRRKR